VKGRPLSYYQAHPRAFDAAVRERDERELAREEARVDVDPDFEQWLTELEPDEDKT
jgi:hypothetical protein